MTTIAVSNTSSLVSSHDVAEWIAAIQIQVDRDFAPIWGVDAKLGMFSSGDYRVILKDFPDAPNDLGFHLVNGSVPEARIFVKPTIDDGDTVSSVLSHEILEMLADPSCVRFTADNRYIIEVCDPVEQTGYDVNGVYVSNFVYPSYFKLTSDTSKYDFNGQLEGPCPALQSGGYIMEWTGTAWVSHFGRRADGSIPYQALRSGRSIWRARNS